VCDRSLSERNATTLFHPKPVHDNRTCVNALSNAAFTHAGLTTRHRTKS